MAIATHAAGESARAHSLIQPVLDRQTPKGYFLAAAPDDNPETHWYHELVILHAIATFAFQTGNAACAAATVIATGAHQRETQPDHATHQPWGLHAFVCNPATLAMADQILHSATTLGGTSGVTSILLADALYCLRL
jgi:hypothetical protein